MLGTKPMQRPVIPKVSHFIYIYIFYIHRFIVLELNSNMNSFYSSKKKEKRTPLSLPLQKKKPTIVYEAARNAAN